MKIAPALVGFLVVVVTASACTPHEAHSSASALDSSSVIAAKSSFGLSEPIVIRYDAFEGNATDWIGIFPADDPAASFVGWLYTDGATRGAVTIPGLTSSGSYVARGFWNDELEVRGESQPFSIVAAPAVWSDAPHVDLGADVAVSFSSFGADPTDRIGLFREGAADDDAASWRSTGGTTDGSIAFSALPAGTYTARGFIAGAVAHSAESAPFTVGSGAVVAATKSTYASAEPVVVTFDRLPGAPTDWIGLYSDSLTSPPALVASQPTGGVTAGAVSFTGLPHGPYRARAFSVDANGVSRCEAESPQLTITEPARVEAVKSLFATDEPIDVVFSGLSGGENQWIGLYLDGSGDMAFVDYRLTGPTPLGAVVFVNVPPGTYRARAFSVGFDRQTESTSFTVEPPPPLARARIDATPEELIAAFGY